MPASPWHNQNFHQWMAEKQTGTYILKDSLVSCFFFPETKSTLSRHLAIALLHTDSSGENLMSPQDAKLPNQNSPNHFG